jgi:hypothetical protein
MRPRAAADALRMIAAALPLRSLAVLPLAAALLSAAPAVRWCALPWSAVTVECFAACETAPAECPPRCGDECSPRPCETGAAAPCATACGSDAAERAASPCGNAAAQHSAPAGDRAFCVEAPLAATPGPGVLDLDPPAAAAVLAAAAEVPEPASAPARPAAFEPPRPASRPPGLPPPVRGPPRVA